MTILNLTQDAATPEQLAAGVIDLPSAARKELRVMLTFSKLPDKEEIYTRADGIAALAAFQTEARTCDRQAGPLQAMIGGALWLMAPLAEALREYGIAPVFAFSVRDTEEQGHGGFVRAIAAGTYP